MRFLRSRDFNLEKAHEALRHTLTWRKQYQIDPLLDSWHRPQLLHNYYTGGWHHQDNGSLSPAHSLKSVNLAGFSVTVTDPGTKS